MPAAKPLKRLLSSNSVLRRRNTPIKPFNTISPRKLKTQDADKADSRSVTDYVMLLYTNNYTQSLLQFFTIFASSGFVVSATIFLLFIYILSLIEDCASPESQGSISNIFSSVDTTDNSYCQAMSQSLWLPTKYSKIWVLNAKGWYANLETSFNSRARSNVISSTVREPIFSQVRSDFLSKSFCAAQRGNFRLANCKASRS